MASILIEQQDNITVIHASGNVTYNELINTIKHNYDLVTCHILWDFTDANLCDITSAQSAIIFECVKKYRPYCPGGKTAFVSTSNGTYGMTRMFSALAEIAGIPYTYRAFRSLDEAFTWLRYTPLESFSGNECKFHVFRN